MKQESGSTPNRSGNKTVQKLTAYKNLQLLLFGLDLLNLPLHQMLNQQIAVLFPHFDEIGADQIRRTTGAFRLSNTLNDSTASHHQYPERKQHQSKLQKTLRLDGLIAVKRQT